MVQAPDDVTGGTRPALVRAIGRWDLTAAVVNAVIGSAIFGMPATQAALTGALSPLAYLAAGLGVLTIVLCFAEVASRFQETGGLYLYARESFGPFVGFQAGWLTFATRVLALSANLNVFVVYLAALLPAVGTPEGRAVTMTAVVALVTVINVLGVRQATWTVNAFTLAKLTPLALLVVMGLGRIRGEVLETQAVASPDWAKAILLLMFAYGGFEAPLIPAGEARNPRRDTAFALLAALAVIAAFYMLVQLAVVGLVPHVAGTKVPVADAFRVLLGAGGATLASVGTMVSIYGYATGTVLQSPRLLFSMSERGDLPRLFDRVHPRFRTPDLAILVYSGLALAFGLYGSFEWNAIVYAVVRLVTYALTCGALLVLRHRRPREEPGFRVRGAWLVAPAGLAFCAWLLSKSGFAQTRILLALVAAGALLWLAGRIDFSRRARRMAGR